MCVFCETFINEQLYFNRNFCTNRIPVGYQVGNRQKMNFRLTKRSEGSVVDYFEIFPSVAEIMIHSGIIFVKTAPSVVTNISVGSLMAYVSASLPAVNYGGALNQIHCIVLY